MKSNAPVDRNFDDLTEKFKRKVYGGLKGEIRLAVIWRDLNQLMALKVMGKTH
jgi:S-adenosylmethionine-dependent methyltransferase